RFGHSGTVPLDWFFYQNAMQPGSVTFNGTNNEVCTAEFVNAGYYMVRAGEEIGGCGYFAEVEIEVPLVPAILVNYNCAGTNQVQLELTNNSDYMTDVVLNTVAWTVDGLPATSPVTVNSGTHTIGLTITYTHDMQQYTCSTSTTVTYLRGDANFITSPGPYCSGSPIQFTDNSTNAVSWVYDFNTEFENLNPNNEQSFEVLGSNENIEISLNIQDNIGCLDNFINNITVNPNGLIGQLESELGPYCSGEEWPFSFNFENIPSGTVNYSWYPVSGTTGLNPNSFLQTGSYYVTMSDNNNCMFQSYIENICFDNTPFAQISGNDVYCPEDVIRLFGESGDYSYLWEGLGYSVYNTANISLPASSLIPGVYSVTLTVSNTNCSSTDVRTITINPKPAAPTIGFGANQCLHEPPVNLQSISGQQLYWSTGDYGLTALTFNPGHHLAHYLHPITGCRSEYDTIYVVKPPDFNELMTGCFKFCPEDLPKTVLPPMGYFDYWAWLRNMIIVQQDWLDIPHPGTLLQITNFGTYNMNIEYSGGACHTISGDLEIMEKEICDSCEIGIKIRNPRCDIRECEMFLDFTYGFFNMSTSSPAVLTEINIVNTTLLSPVLPISIPANTGMDISFSFILESLEPQTIQIEFVFNQNHVFCSRIVTVNLADILDDCITETCEGSFVSADLNTNLSNSALSYYDFVLQFQTGMTNVQVYSDQVTVFNYGYNVYTGIIDGLFAITPLELQSLIDNHEEICFRVYGCRNDVICVTEICFPASELAGGAKSMLFDNLDEDSNSAPEKEQYFCTDFSLHPNPAINTITVSCSESEFSSAVIFDMKGQKLKTVSEKLIVISDLQPGDYIVKVISKSGKCQYLKFVKR
ncbi:MAG: T9SS type A sorting domain-containing protein, partial [Bacteroidales bacterium]|nr:T9SS type A sorting domain-containing protein [Bacteroidales bacterium]